MTIRKGVILVLGVALLASSCSTNTATGALAGGQFGNILGSAVGGISGGWRGHHMGSLIGTVGGAAAGAAIGSAVDRAQERKRQEAMGETPRRNNRGNESRGRGNDRVTYIQEDTAPLEIRNAMIVESRKDGVLTRGEECTVVFEIMNTSDQTVYDVMPLVEELTGNKNIKISPNLNIERIAPHQRVRYTAAIVGNQKLKDGEIQVLVGVAIGGQEITSQTLQFTVPTAKQVQ